MVPPLVRLCELCSRVNDHFSYDDIENSDTTNETMLELSTNSFRKERSLIREFTARSLGLRENTTLHLMSCSVGIRIDECCLYTSLWRTPVGASADSPSLLRLKMFHRTFEATTSNIQSLLQTPKGALFRLGLQSWASWFHIVVVICKLVFLEDNERFGDANIEDLPQELGNLFSDQEDDRRQGIEPGKATSTSWNPEKVAEQYNVRGLFESFTEMLQFTLPVGCAPWSIPRDMRDSHSIACIQYLMLFGLKKRIKPLSSSTTSNDDTSVVTPTITNRNVKPFCLIRLSKSRTSQLKAFRRLPT
ncbi:hypothetical protein NX059_004147 [Plenodomus lindquistii]|nr:hypothetical protein NX059_004147 [Plenodomus lindquistii]